MTITARWNFGTRITAVTLAVLASWVVAGLQPAQAAEAAAPETIVLKAAHVFDSTGAALKDGVTVLIRGDRIVSVGTAAPPPGARVIDLGGRHAVARLHRRAHPPHDAVHRQLLQDVPR
jgi:hypothetical protein